MRVASPYETIPPEDAERGRLVAAVAYLPGLCFLGLLGMPENTFVGFHARQGFLVFMVEIVIWIFLAIFDASVGLIPFVGPLAGYILKFALWCGLLAATIFGVVKAAGGEVARLPYLGECVERVPF